MTSTTTGQFWLSPGQNADVRARPRATARADVRVRGVDAAAVQAAARRLFEDHPLLGVQIVVQEGGGLLRVGGAPSVRTTPRAGAVGGGEQHLAGSVSWVTCSAEEWQLTITLPHIIADGTTLRNLQHDLVALLAGTVRTPPPPLESYLRYVAWNRAQQRDNRPLPGRPASEHTAPFLRSGTGAGGAPTTMSVVAAELDADAREALAAAADRTSVPAALVGLVAWREVLTSACGGAEPLVAVRVDERGAGLPPLEGDAAPVHLLDQALPRNPDAALAQIYRWWKSRPGNRGQLPVPGHAAYGFVALDGPVTVRVAGLVAELEPPRLPAVGSIASLSLGLRENVVRVELSFDSARVFGDDALALLDTFEHRLRSGRPGSLTALPAAPAAPASLLERVRAHAAGSPEVVAVSSPGADLTYRAVVELADRVTGALLEAGTAPEECVGILGPETPALVAAALGVLGAGAAYVPLDPRLPRKRLAQMVAAAGIRTVLVEGDTPVPMEDVHRLVIGGPDAVPATPPVANPEQLAYVLFTSGSSGEPKGVMVTRAGLDHYLEAAAAAYLDGPGDVVCFTSAAFDLTVTGLLLPLREGRTVRLLPAHTALTAVADEVARRRVALVKLTPAHLSLLVPLLPDGLRVHSIVVGGAELTVDLVERARSRVPGARIFNEYGPTETVVGCAVRQADGSERGLVHVPIGDGLGHATPSVLASDGSRAFELQPGELAIGGPTMARGYLGDPRATAARFVPDPEGAPGARRYLSGDVAVQTRAQGLIFIGRYDDQVSVNGHRVECAEVEAAIRAITGIDEVAVRARRDADAGDRLLAVVAVADDRAVPTQEILASLAEQLPSYMVPARLARVRSLPLTPNGKVDTAAVLAAAETAPPTRAPRNRAAHDTVEAVRAAWSEVIGQPDPPLDVSFLTQGGTSFSLVRLIGLLRTELGVDLEVAAAFEHPTVADLASHLEGIVNGHLKDSSAIPAPCTPSDAPVTELPSRAAARLAAAQRRRERGVQ